MKIFLDLDGPILDNAGKYYRIYADLLRHVGCPLLSPEEYWQLKRERVPEVEILRRTCAEEIGNGYLAKRLALIEDFKYLVFDEVQDGVRGVLDDWRRHEVYLVTLRRRQETLLRQLDHLTLTGCFREVFSEDANDGTWQVKCRLLQNRMGGRLTGIMIGDTEVDIEAGKALGLRTVAVTCGIRSRELLEDCGPDEIVDRLTEVVL